MSILIVESGVSIDSNPPTGVGFVDLKREGTLRLYDSDTIKFSASGSSDKRKGYVTMNAVQTPAPPPLPQPLPQSKVLQYYHQYGFSTPIPEDVVYPPGSNIPMNGGGTVVLSNEVIVNDVNGDGSVFRVDTPGLYNITVMIPSGGIIGLTFNDQLIVQTSLVSINMNSIDCVIQISTGDTISLINSATLPGFGVIVRGMITDTRLYTSIFFDRYIS